MAVYEAGQEYSRTTVAAMEQGTGLDQSRPKIALNRNLREGMMSSPLPLPPRCLTKARVSPKVT